MNNHFVRNWFGCTPNQYKEGPSTDPWGTPYVNIFESDRTPLMLTRWVMSHKYEFEPIMCIASNTVHVVTSHPASYDGQ